MPLCTQQMGLANGRDEIGITQLPGISYTFIMIDTTRPPLLTTKFFRPTIRENLIARTRLYQKLDNCPNCRLILVTAPAGSGKTTLITSWLAQQEKAVAWVSLDKNDNDPLTFLSYVAAALHDIESGVCKTIRPLLSSSDPPSISVLLTYFINDLACLTEPTILVLDDYHIIDAPAVDEVTDFLIENRPPNLQIIIISRAMPAFSLARWRAQNDIAEIDLTDLRFNYDEASRFLHEIMKLSLPDEEVALLYKQTEGWVTGLQLAALGLRNRNNSSEFIHEMSGDDRLIGDYLVDEVIEQQSLQVRQFLVRTSILHRFSAPLCNALLGIDNAQELLLYLERANLFLVSLDNRRGWYRYHHLFGDMLRARLDQKQPALISTLYQRAIEWHEQNGFIQEAIDYAVEGGFYKKTAVLIEQNFDKFQTGSQRRRIIQWVEAIPEEVLKEHDVLWSQYILALFYFADFDTALSTLRRLWHEAQTPKNKLQMVRAIENPLLAAITLHTTLNAQRVRDLSQQALAILPEDNMLMRGIALGHYGSASLYLGELQTARQYLSQATPLIENTYSWSIYTVFQNYLIETSAVEGHLREAAEQYHELHDYVYERGLQESSTFAVALIWLGLIYYEWNDLEKAEQLIREGQRLAEVGSSIESLLLACHATVKLHLARGEFPDVKDKLDHLEILAANSQYPSIVMERIGCLRSMLALYENAGHQAKTWAYAFAKKQNNQVSCLQQSEWLTVARINLVTGKAEECLQILEELQALALEQNRIRDSIWIGTLLARTWYQLGEKQLALSKFTILLSMAEPEGYLRSFVDAGLPVPEMLAAILEGDSHSQTNNPSPTYIQKILDAFPEKVETKKVSAPKILTPRELEVLNLLADGNSYAQIAQQLFITENTIKTHIKRIYGKLNVHDRMNAVLVAQEIGLL